MWHYLQRTGLKGETGLTNRLVTLPAPSELDNGVDTLGELRGGAREDVICSMSATRSEDVQDRLSGGESEQEGGGSTSSQLRFELLPSARQRRHFNSEC